MPEFALLKGVTDFLVDLGGAPQSSLSIFRPSQGEVVSKAFPDSPDFVLVICGPNGTKFIDQIIEDFSLLQTEPISLTNYQSVLPLLEGVFTCPTWRPRGIEFAPVDRLTFLEIFGFLARLRELHRDIKTGVFFAPAITNIDQSANGDMYFVAGDLSQRLVAGLNRGQGRVKECHCVLLRPGFVLAFTGVATLEAVKQDSTEILKSIDSLERAASRMTAHFAEKKPSSSAADFLYLNSVNLALRADGTPDAALRFASACGNNDSLVLRNLGGSGRTWQAVRHSLDRTAVLELAHCRGLVDAVEKVDLWEQRVLGSVFMV